MVCFSSYKNVTNSAKEYDTVFHIHNCCEFLYVSDGEIITKVVDKTYKVQGGQLLITCRLEGHGIKPVVFPYKRIAMFIESEMLHSKGVSQHIMSILEHHPEGWNHLFDLNQYPETKELMEKIHNEIIGKNQLAQEMAGALFYQLLIQLYRHFPDRFVNAKKDVQMEEAKRYIEEHLTDFPQVKNMSKMYYMTTTRFIDRFKKHTGYTPHKYYNICRMAKARYLLSTGNETLAEIAEKSGFLDLNSFVRAFRSTMGITPGKFRENMENDQKTNRP